MNKTEREIIKRKTDAMKVLEEVYKDMKLSFDYKTVYFHRDNKFWQHSFYEVSYIEANEKKNIGFYAKRGHSTLSFYLARAMKKGGYEQQLSAFNKNDK